MKLATNLFSFLAFLISLFPNLSSAMIADKNKLWPPGKNLIIQFKNGSEKLQNEVAQIANEWTIYANINFYFVNSKDSKSDESLAPHINIEFVPMTMASGTMLGTDANGYFHTIDDVTTMYLGVEETTDLVTKRKVVLHEFGHVLGLDHEHNHPRRPFIFKTEVIEAYCTKGDFDRSGCDYNIMRLADEDSEVLPYDSNSVMQYTDLLNEAYILKVRPISLHPNQGSLSLFDKLGIAILYPFTERGENFVDNTLLGIKAVNALLEEKTQVLKNKTLLITEEFLNQVLLASLNECHRILLNSTSKDGDFSCPAENLAYKFMLESLLKSGIYSFRFKKGPNGKFNPNEISRARKAINKAIQRSETSLNVNYAHQKGLDIETIIAIPRLKADFKRSIANFNRRLEERFLNLTDEVSAPLRRLVDVEFYTSFPSKTCEYLTIGMISDDGVGNSRDLGVDGELCELVISAFNDLECSIAHEPLRYEGRVNEERERSKECKIQRINIIHDGSTPADPKGMQGRILEVELILKDGNAIQINDGSISSWRRK